MTWWLRFGRFVTPRRMKYAWITGAALWLAWLVSIALGPGNLDLAGNVIGTDYLQFYTSGITLRLHGSQRLYDFPFQQELEQAVVGGQFESIYAFLTPPFFAWLYLPLSFLPYTVSFLAWSLLGLVLLWASLRWLGVEHPWRAFLWALTWFPVFASISFGQNSLLSLAILSLVYFLWLRRRPWAAGLVSSLLLYKPQFLLGVSLLWCLDWRREGKSLLGLFLGAGLLGGLSFWAMPQASREYLAISRQLLSNLLTLEGFPLWHAHTLRAFWLLIFPGGSTLAELFALAVSLAGLGAFLRLWWKQRVHPSLVYAAAIGWTVLVSPHAMIYDWALLLIPAVLLWKKLPERRAVWQPLFAALWIVSILSGSLTLLQLRVFDRAVQFSIPVLLLVSYAVYKNLTVDAPPQEGAAGWSVSAGDTL